MTGFSRGQPQVIASKCKRFNTLQLECFRTMLVAKNTSLRVCNLLRLWQETSKIRP
jgi:hypothetical protein